MRLPLRGEWRFARKTKTLTFNGQQINLTFFDSRPSGYHGTVDISCDTDTVLQAPADGTVYRYSYDQWFGKFIQLDFRFAGGVRSFLFCHLNSSAVSAGKKVKAADRLGRTDNTGYSTGPHLHPELWWDPRNRDTRADPYWLFCWMTEAGQGLRGHVNPYPTPRSPALGGRTIQQGDRGYPVAWVQWALRRPKVDGNFTEKTEAQLMRFQRDHRLAPTGRVNVATYRALKAVTR